MARRPPNTSRGSWRSAAAACAALALACGGGGEAEDASDGTSPATAQDGPTSGTDPDGTGDADATAGTSDGSGDATGDESSSSGPPPPPPPECGALTACGVQCTDVMSDPNNCGKCGVSCVIPTSAAACSAGVCTIGTCKPGLADCDGDVNNGCETPLGPGQSCPFMCMMGAAEVCNLLDDNCDGQCDEGGVAGCRQPVHRSSSPTIGHFYTLDVNEAMSGDITLVAMNYFYTYVGQLPGLVPFYRCLKPNGKRFYTTSDVCEGGGTAEGILGYVAGDALCGAIPLYRLYAGAGGDHFYTISAEERDNAVAMFGYAYESVAGHVWPGP